jgi:two-component system sensor histidine kinase UhpB
MITQIQRINARLLEQLRPVILDQLPLAQALQKLAEGWRGRYPAMTWTVDAPPALDLSDERNQAIYRSAQEALTNVVRHAKARRVAMSLSSDAGLVKLTVADDGVGLPEGGRMGIGLLGMQERAKALGGRLVLGKSALGGALIELEIPEADEDA